MLLWSFEGARATPAVGRRGDLDNLGGHSDGDTPLPIPNREVKPASADGTRGASPRESRTPPSLIRRSGNPLVAGFLTRQSRRRSLSRPHVAARQSLAVVPRLLAWSFATAISCCVRGRRTTSMRWSPAATTRRSRAGSRRFRLRTRRRMRSRSSAARSHRTSRRLAIDDSTAQSSAASGSASTDQGTAATIGYWVAAHARGQGTCTRALRLLSRYRSRRARASTARPRHRSRQRRVATCCREGRVPARGRPSRSPATPGRADSRLGDVLAATRRASRVTNRGRGRSSRLRARGDAARDRRAVGAS